MNSSKESSSSAFKLTAKRYLKHWDLILMVIPGLIALIIFNYLPMGGIIIAFKNFRPLDGILGSEWVGLDNFARLFSGTDFLNVLRNTLVISVLKIIFGFPAPIIFALLLNELRNLRAKKVIQTISYLPHFFSWVVLSGIIIMIFSSTGPISIIFDFFGMKMPEFFADGKSFIFMVVFSAVWQGLGWGSIIYLAALSGIDEAMYEAASIDGASRLKQIIYISIPCIVPTMVISFILNLNGILNAGFDQIYNMYNPMVYDVADILDTYVLRRLQKMDYSFGTAIGLFKSVVGMTLILSSNALIRKFTDGEQGIW